MYEQIDKILIEAIGPSAGFQELVQPEPYTVDQEFVDVRTRRIQVVQEFFSQSVKILDHALKDEFSPDVLELLLGDAPPAFNAEATRNLPSELLQTPLFTRTDESASGKIMEFQCPGSGWGDAELLTRAYKNSGQAVTDSPSARYVKAVQQLTNKESPAVLQLLDAASAPVGMRFLMASTRPQLRYWGLDSDVNWGDCDLVRAHTPFALLGENQISRRTIQAVEGRTLLDPPFHVLFAQKATLALPFEKETSDLFSDDVRDMIAYSAVLRADGFRDETGDMVSVDEFLKRPPRDRRWFLKYAGSDQGMSWGGRSVFRLDSSDARKRLEHASSEPGRWILQPEVTNK